MTFRLALVGFASLLVSSFAQNPTGAAPTGAAAFDISAVKVAPGFHLSVFAEGIKGVRTLASNESGLVLAASPDQKQIFALRDTTGAGKADKIVPITENTPQLHGMVLHGNTLWFSESGAVLTATLGADDKPTAPPVVLIGPDRLPSGGGHWTRTLAIGPDGRIYTELGSSGNINEDADTPAAPNGHKRQKLWTYAADGTDEKLFCVGLRNTQQIDWQPQTGELWGTDQGSDNISKDPAVNDVTPSDEFNQLQPGGDYGHPYISTDAHGEKIIRPEYASRPDIQDKLASVIAPGFALGAHISPTGWTFYRGGKFPADYNGAAIICMRGSWNRTVKDGYRVSALIFKDGKPVELRVLADFLSADKKSYLDRPVDAVNYKDGSILFTGETGGRVYRLSWGS